MFVKPICCVHTNIRRFLTNIRRFLNLLIYSHNSLHNLLQASMECIYAMSLNSELGPLIFIKRHATFVALDALARRRYWCYFVASWIPWFTWMITMSLVLNDKCINNLELPRVQISRHTKVIKGRETRTYGGCELQLPN